MAANLILGRAPTERERRPDTEEVLCDTLACNKNPRYSLAALLTRAALARNHASPGLAGRLPAPRGEFGCDLDTDLPGAYSPVLANRPTQFSGIAGVDPIFVTPPPSPTPDPFPLPDPVPDPDATPGPGPGPGPAPGPEDRPTQMCCPPREYTPRTITFHLGGMVAGGNANTELRVSQRIARQFEVTQIAVLPIAGVTAGQYLDILVSSDDDATDTATPTGSSIFQLQGSLATVPTVDQDRGLPLVTAPYHIFRPYRVTDQNSVLKVQTRFTAPAIALPTLHVVVTIKETDETVTPIDVRPSPRPAPIPQPGPPPRELPPPVGTPAPEPQPFPGPPIPVPGPLNNCTPFSVPGVPGLDPVMVRHIGGQVRQCTGPSAPGYMQTGQIKLPTPIFDYLSTVVVPTV